MRKLIVCMMIAAGLSGGALRADTLQLEGSTTVGPIADAFAEYFKSSLYYMWNTGRGAGGCGDTNVIGTDPKFPF